MNNSQLHKCFAAVSNGDMAAFESLYNDMKIPLFTIICRITKDKTAAEDVMQDLFVKLYCSPPPDNIKNIRAWIFKSAHNSAIDCLRKSSRLELTDDEMPDGNFPSEEFIGLRLDTERALLQLDEKERAIISLRINAELTFRDIAEVLNMPVGTVLWRYQKAIGRLKTILSGGRL